MQSTSTRIQPIKIEGKQAARYFHGTANEFSKFSRREWRDEQWVYLTDDFQAAQYYSVIAMSDKKHLKRTNGECIPSSLGLVYEVFVPKTLLIAKLTKSPNLVELIALERMGYGGATYPDTKVNQHGDWNVNLLGAMPANSRATVIFDLEKLVVGDLRFQNA